MARLRGLRPRCLGFDTSGLGAAMQRAVSSFERLSALTGRETAIDRYIRRVARETIQSPTTALEGARSATMAGHEDLVLATAVCSAAPLRTVAAGVGLAVGYFVDPAFVSALDASSDSLELRTPPSVWVVPPPVELFSA